jgi:exodeoxyribonuclease III
VNVRLMTWNVRSGGGDRWPALRAVIDRVRPDVLVLQELRGVPAVDGMVAHVARPGFGQGVAVLVRPPSTVRAAWTVRWRLHHAAVAADLGPLTVVGAHLNPFSPYRRMREAVWLAARFRRRSGGRVIVTGDLNGLAPGEDHSAEVARLPERYRRRHLLPGGGVDTRAVAAFAAAGYLDLWPRCGTGDGRTAPTSNGGGPEFSGMRVDYVLATPPVAGRARTMRVVRGDETEYASDHYPVLVELD